MLLTNWLFEKSEIYLHHFSSVPAIVFAEVGTFNSNNDMPKSLLQQKIEKETTTKMQMPKDISKA